MDGIRKIVTGAFFLRAMTSAYSAVRAAAAAMARQMMRILFAVRFFICQQSTTSEPKGMNASFANLKYWSPSGMPIIVQQQTTPIAAQ